MLPSVQTLVLTLTTLAVGGAEGLKLNRRADAVDTTSVQGLQNVLITNPDQNQFYTQMQFGSGNGAVNLLGLVSTTRSDIILPGVYGKNLTGYVSQGKSVVEGPIYSGPVSAGGWTVPDQDVVYYENATAVLPVPFNGKCAYGGFGIWPNTSTVNQAIGDWSADSFIPRILAEPAAGPYWTLLINPSEDDRGTDESFGGVFTIGEIVNITQIFNISQADLKKYNVPDLTLVTQYPVLNHTGVCDGITYYTLIDAISCGNRSVTLNSSVTETPKGKISAYIDSTSPWNQVPYSITEELYKGLENATYAKDTGLWHFKCTELSVNITIGGRPYPLSPLTVAQHVNSLTCVGTFQAKPANVRGDIVLGVPFLKNVYARFAYQTRSGDAVSGPYAQLMPIINVQDAHNDWVTWYNKWGGSSSQRSSVSPSVQPTPSSLSTRPLSSSLSTRPLSSSLSTRPPSSSLSTPPLSSSLSTHPPPSSSPSTHPPPSSSLSAYPPPSSSLSTHPPPSSVTPPVQSTPSSYSTSPSSSASDPVSTGGSNHVAGAVEDDNSQEKSDPVKRYLPAIIVGAVIGGLALIGGIIFAVKKLRHGRDGKGAYRGLEKPDDIGPVKVPLYDAEGGSGRYGEGGQGRYTDPYED